MAESDKDIRKHQQLLDISMHAYDPEEESLEALQPDIERYNDLFPKILTQASEWVQAARDNTERRKGLDVEAFLQEYGLDSKEGISLMRLAECLLRIEDNETADALVHDTLEDMDWKHHLGHSSETLINASSMGLFLAEKLLNLKGWAGKTSEALIRKTMIKAVETMGASFILGQDTPSAIKHSKKWEKQGYLFSYDMLGEGARTMSQAEIYFEHYLEILQAMGKQDSNIPLYQRPSISIKLSALHPAFHWRKRKQLRQELIPKLHAIIASAMKLGISVTFDAEEASRLDITLHMFETIIRDKAFAGFDGIGIAVQAYQKRAPYVIGFVASLAEETQKYIPVRLVKGAYWDSEIKFAQLAGLPGYPVYTEKANTDFAYLACAQKMLSHNDVLYPQFATHNILTMASICQMAQGKVFEFQRLFGMGESVYSHLMECSNDEDVEQSYIVRIYAPVGEYKDLLAYLIRRLLENGANSSFVHLLANPDIPVETLLENPVKTVLEKHYAPNADIPVPKELFSPNRHNSLGMDMGNAAQLDELCTSLAAFCDAHWQAMSIIDGQPMIEQFSSLTEPQNAEKQVGEVSQASEEMCQTALASAHHAFDSWQQTSMETRIAAIQTLAGLYESHTNELIALCAREAGKTLEDAIAEVREAIDFCHYYAAQAKQHATPVVCPGPTGESNILTLHGKGTFICISPWNFPLAIFTGQVIAALLAGNCVIAKPAEQTPLIATYAVKLMHEAGIPTKVLQLVIGDGAIGAHLVASNLIAGVAFTGSFAAAQSINRSLANRDGKIVPLIAETGGLNTMIIDSSALLEQAVDDILISAFGSAGQRCSALRVLYVQDTIADTLIQLIHESMELLIVGDPMDPATDIGPVIDHEAKRMIANHIASMKKHATHIGQTPLDKNIAKQGHFIAPHAFEIESISQLTQEIFGPVLHIIRFSIQDLDRIIEEINATGYGLTFGIHSRIDSRVQHITTSLHTGNQYVNRSMTGAVVGVQPFGGEGLSGTGFKAGGPHYLLRFVNERTLTTNTAAIGGNIALLS